MKEEIDVEGFRGKLPSYLRQGIPPYLQILFSARAPLPYIPPVSKPHKINLKGFFTSLDYKKISETLTKKREERMEKNHLKIEKERMILKKISYKEKREKWKKKMKEHIKIKKKEYKKWLKEKLEKTNKTENPYKTLIVYKLDYEIEEELLKKEFSLYGKIEKIRLIKDLKNKSRGYAFIEFEREKDFISAYRQASGKKILDKRIEVDAEYGRSRKSFRPLRLGGGLNKSRRSKNHCFPIEYHELRRKKKIKKVKKKEEVKVVEKVEVVEEKREGDGMVMEMEEGEIVNCMG